MSNTMIIPNHAHEITPEWLTRALQEGGVDTLLNGETAVAAIVSTSIGEDESFAGGSLTHLEITYTRPKPHLPATIIAKCAPSDPELRETMKGNSFREAGFYKEAHDQSHLPIPHCYYNDVDEETGKAILLLQDLSHYRIVSFAGGCNPQDTESVVRALAEIHLHWWNSPRLNQFSGSEILLEFPFSELWRNYPEKIANLLPDFQIPESLLRIGSLIADNTSPILERLNETAPMTCIHRDIHVDNALFSDKDGDAPAIILDWQGAGRGRGAYDIAYFLISSVPPAQRRRTEQTLLQLYHSLLIENGVDDYDFETCWFDYRLAFVTKFFVSVISTVLLDNSTPFKRTWRRTDLQRLLAFCEDHAVAELLLSFIKKQEYYHTP